MRFKFVVCVGGHSHLVDGVLALLLHRVLRVCVEGQGGSLQKACRAFALCVLASVYHQGSNVGSRVYICGWWQGGGI